MNIGVAGTVRYRSFGQIGSDGNRTAETPGNLRTNSRTNTKMMEKRREIVDICLGIQP